MTLRIESALVDVGGAFSEKFQLMKHRLLTTEYEHWAAGFSAGNNHGRGHILRVLEHLDQLLGPTPTHVLSPYELFLTMMAILYHDIGLLRQRKGHEDISKALLEGDTHDAYIINSIDKEIIAAAVVSHSSSKDISEECARFSDEEIAGEHKARPRVIAALVRLADELDEDYRRADPILQERLGVPAESEFFWRFNQRVRGIRPTFVAKRIDLNLAFTNDDTGHVGVLPGGTVRHFVAFSAEKLAKINQERVYVNQFLPPELQYGGLHVDVKPLPSHETWRTPRTFVFNDKTTSKMFVQSFPELLDEPGRVAMNHVLTLMASPADLADAEKHLEQLARATTDLAPDLQMAILYARACILSMKSKGFAKGSPEREQALDSAATTLVEWITRGRGGAFKSMGRTEGAELGRMRKDPELSRVRRERSGVISKAAEGAQKGCVPSGTFIETPSGVRLVEDLKVGDQVFSIDVDRGSQKAVTTIARIVMTRSDRCVRLRESWVVTPTQPVRTATEWTEASKLNMGDCVMRGDGTLVRIEPPVIVHGDVEVYDLTVDSPHHNFIANGMVCHNKF